MTKFKVGDEVRRIKDTFETLPIGTKGIVEKCENNILRLKGRYGWWTSSNFELVEEKPEEIEYFKPGWTIQNNKSKALHTVMAVAIDGYMVKAFSHKRNHYLSFRNAHSKEIGGGYSVIKRDELVLAETLPCVRVIPPVSIPEKKQIVPGPLYENSSMRILWVDISSTCLKLSIGYMNKNSLRKTAQAMNILADILEENEQKKTV